ncbi:MAG: HAD domain-containing protein [Betaproteobacteria bacterium]
MKTIFTDIDGVFCPVHESIHGNHQDSVDSINVNLLWANLLADLLGDVAIQIVIHSSWRYRHSIDEIKKIFPESIQKKIVGTVVDHGRYDGIMSYVELHKIKEFIVLDDVADFFPMNWSYLILCDSEKGLSDINVQKKILDFVT